MLHKLLQLFLVIPPKLELLLHIFLVIPPRKKIQNTAVKEGNKKVYTDKDIPNIGCLSAYISVCMS